MSLFVSFLFLSSVALAEEEEFQLDEVQENKSSHHPMIDSSQFRLMGRLDLTSEIYPFTEKNADQNHEFETFHYFIFLKMKASKKTSFFGEIISQRFYYVVYSPSATTSITFGKILVPFGNNEHFHHFYGGVRTLGGKGVLFPDVWAENGLNVGWSFTNNKIDVYTVNGATAVDSTTQKLDLNESSTKESQAVGFRLTNTSISKFEILGSYYFTEWQMGQSLNIVGGDLKSDYGFLGMHQLRFGMGSAFAFVDGHPDGSYRKSGDYIYIATNLLNPVELKLRYGTYIDDNEVETEKDTQGLVVSLSTAIDVIRVSAQYEFNYEAINEVENDLFRIMAALDF